MLLRKRSLENVRQQARLWIYDLQQQLMAMQCCDGFISLTEYGVRSTEYIISIFFYLEKKTMPVITHSNSKCQNVYSAPNEAALSLADGVACVVYLQHRTGSLISSTAD